MTRALPVNCLAPRQIVHGSIKEQSNNFGVAGLDSVIAFRHEEAVMTDPRDYIRRGEALGSTAWGWILGIGTAALIGLLIVLNYNRPTDTNTASNSAPSATSNSPPRVGPSTSGSGALPEQPSQDKPGN
jgi:hypothetical protein